MVDFFDMSASELYGAVEAFPWFAPARARLCMMALGSSGEDAASSALAEALPFLPDGSYVAARIHGTKLEKYRDASLTVAAQPARRVVMAGMDYFSREDYDTVRRDDDDRLRNIAVFDDNAPAPRTDPSKECSEGFNMVTETLAEIYVSQNHPEVAIEIYRKLSLQKPEKSAYFATLIDNLKS